MFVEDQINKLADEILEMDSKNYHGLMAKSWYENGAKMDYSNQDFDILQNLRIEKNKLSPSVVCMINHYPEKIYYAVRKGDKILTSGTNLLKDCTDVMIVSFLIL